MSRGLYQPWLGRAIDDRGGAHFHGGGLPCPGKGQPIKGLAFAPVTGL
jgi:hypothetical protein